MAQTIEAAIARCNPDEALNADDPRRVNFDDLRGGVNTQTRILRLLGSSVNSKTQPYQHLALVGHRGSGKSTELRAFVREVQRRGYLPLYANVQDTLGSDVSYSDILRLLVQLLDYHFIANPKLDNLPSKTLETVADWFRSKTKITEAEIEKSWHIGSEAEIGPNVEAEGDIDLMMVKAKVKTGLGKLLFSLSGTRNSSNKVKEEIREAIEHSPQSLLENVNLLLDDAVKNSNSVYPKGILFVLDNVDRLHPTIVDKAFVQSAELIQSVRTNLIFTVPISLMFNPPGERIRDRYTCVPLPIVPVYERGSSATPKNLAVDRWLEAIYKRVEPALFANEAVARQAVMLSGGSPRDLMRLLQTALLETSSVITETVLKRAAQELATDMARSINKVQFQKLAYIHLEGAAADADADVQLLLYRRDALEYNGEGWLDAHPLLQLTRQFKEALKTELAQRNPPSTP